jgi:hypothetical protein
MSQSEFQQEQLRLLNLIYEELRRIGSSSSNNSRSMTAPALDNVRDTREDEEEELDDELESFE